MRERILLLVSLILCVMVGSSTPLSAQGPSFIRGDCNTDGNVDIGDAITALGFLFSGTGPLNCESACDCNDDGNIDIGDAICILDSLFGMPAIPPRPPFPDCGPDPTDDPLTCDSFTPCPDPPTAVLVADPISGPLPLQVFFDGSASSSPIGPLDSLAWDFGDGVTARGIFVEHTYTSIGMFTATLTVTDQNGLTDVASIVIDATMAADPVTIESSSPASGETGVAVTRETIIAFSAPVDPATVDANSFQASFGGVPLPLNIHVNSSEAFIDTVTLFYPGLLPGGSLVDVSIDGDLLLDAIGRPVDVDGDGTTGGQYTFQFSTLSLVPVVGTSVCGRVFASEYDEAVAGQPVNVPLEGVTITLDGVDPGVVSAITDVNGSFRLEPVPAGVFFVHVDGRTVASAIIDGVLTPTVYPGGPYYPFVGKPFESIATQEVILSDIFLPLVEAGSLVEVSETEDTQVCMPASVVAKNPELAGVCMTVPAASLYADDGTQGGMVGIAPVDPARLPGPLPPELNPALVITVQTDGATNFDVPAPICLPNLPDPRTGLALSPGDESALLSFNHDIGEWEVVGSMTVTSDGALICTDPGSGILAPGWHAPAPVTSIGDGEITDPDFLIRNEPDAEGQEPISDDVDADAACTKGSKVYLHNGEESFERVDLVIPGRGDINFVMRRRYRSRVEINGPLGHGWDFDYNDAIFVQPNGDLKRCNGRGRITLWESAGSGSFLRPLGCFVSCRRAFSGVITRRSPDGYKRLYHPDGRLFAHEDRHGNRMIFEYDRYGNLELVVDPYGREIRFFHTLQSDGARRLTLIRDFTGREVRYFYDGEGDLVRVRTPVVTNTPTQNNFPDGREEVYTYSSGFASPELNHNLLSVKFPEEVENGGPVGLSWVYGTDPADLLTFDKVIEEHIGGGAINSSGVPAGGTITFNYEQLNQGSPLGQPELPRGKVTVTERNGTQYEYFVNEKDHHIITRHLTQGLRPGEPAFYETRFFYDDDGQLLREIEPEGNEIQFTYDSVGNRAQQKNVIEIRRIADPDRGGGEDRIATMTYEPIFNRLRTKTGARGNAANFTPPIGVASPERYTLKRFYDYQEGTAQDILLLALELEVNLDPDGSGPITAMDVALDLSLDADLNADAMVTQQVGNVIRTEFPTVQLLDESGAVVLQPIVAENQWNDFGQLVKSLDTEGNVTNFEYQPITNPNGMREFRSLLMPLPIGAAAGYQSAIVEDAEESYRRTSTVPPTVLRSEFTYDTVGNPIATKNPRGVITTTEYNSLNEPIVVTYGADVTDAAANGQLITGEVAFEYQTRHFYDYNGRAIRTEVVNLDGNTPGVGAFVETVRQYDLLGNLVQESIEVDATNQVSWQYRYDESELLTTEIEPEGNQRHTEYDERNLLFRVTQGFGSPESSTRQYDYDLNGNLVRQIDAEDNDGDGQPESNQHIYDGFDRQIRRIDALGNELTFEYDVSSNITRKTIMGHPPGNPGAGNVLLQDSLLQYDELSRRYQVDNALFLSTGFTAVHPVNLNDQNSDGFVTTRTVYDAMSRGVFTIEDDLQVTEFVYDGASRPVEVIDAIGNRIVREYDNNSNVIRETSIEVSPTAAIPDESFSSTHVYDQLDRLVRTTDHAGQTNRFDYDSRGNMIASSDAQGPIEVDPLGLYPGPGQVGDFNAPGNVARYVHDGLNRVIVVENELRVNGGGGGAIDTSNPSNPDGLVQVTSTYDGNSRLIGRTDDAGNLTAFNYDSLNRPIRQLNADGTEFQYTYDRDHNLTLMIDPNGTITERILDPLNRVIQVGITRGAGVLGTTEVINEYDGLSRKTRSVDNNDLDPQICEYVYDSISRVLEERQNGAAFANELSGDGKRQTLRYPGGRVVNRTFDSIDRLETCSDGNGLISAHSWIGPRLRALRRTHGDGTEESYLDPSGTSVIGYDDVKRVVEQRFLLPDGTPFVDREYDYNRESYRTLELRHDDFGLTDSYTYDSIYRVTESEFDQNGLPGATPRDLEHRSYTLDGVGNRVEVDENTTSGGAATTNYATNNVNEYTSISGIVRAHDDNGNLVSDGESTFSYDYQNRLVLVRDAVTNPVAEYRYYSDGRRAEKVVYSQSVPGQIDKRTQFVYDDWQVCEEVDADSGNSEVTYLWDPRHIDRLIQFERTGNHPLGSGTYYVHQNVRHDTVAITQSGIVAETHRYDDYGIPEQRSSLGNPYLFQGHRFDAETSLYYLRNRYYDPVTGRLLQRDALWDPSHFGNQYTFAGNSPASQLDPLGLNNRRELTKEQKAHLATLHNNLNELLSSRTHRLFGWLTGTDEHVAEYRRQLEEMYGQDTSWVDNSTYDGGHGTAAELSGVADIDNSMTYLAGSWESSDSWGVAIGVVALVAVSVDAVSNIIPGKGAAKGLAKGALSQGAESGVKRVRGRAPKSVPDPDGGFTADLSKSNAKSRSGHRNAGNKQLNDKMNEDPAFRADMEKRHGSDVFDRTSTSGSGRRNPANTEWDHNTTDPNKLDLRTKPNHRQKTSAEGQQGGGWKRFHKDKEGQ